jgi:antitoxin CptB
MASGATETSDGLDARRRRVLWRAWHRGTREMDLVMGRFADRELRGMAERELDEFERLIEAPDRDVFAWVTGAEPTPANYDGPVFRRLKEMHLG